MDTTSDRTSEIKEINDQENIRWLISFLSIDKKKTFCLYEGISFEATRWTDEQASIPADEIIEMGEEILPDGIAQKLRMDRVEKTFFSQDNKES